MRFADKVVLITGSGAGIGRAAAQAFARAGARLIVNSQSLASGSETLELIKGAGGAALFVQGDVAQSEDARRMVEAAVHGFGRLDIVVNNAGIVLPGRVDTISESDWERTFAVCWGGVYHGTRTFLPMLIASDAGHIVNTSSINGFFASVGPARAHTAYSTAKFAVKGFTEALITDLRLNAPHVHASVVMPGHIGTSIVINSLRAFGRDPKEQTEEQLAELRIELGRQGMDLAALSDEEMRVGIQMMAEGFRDLAPTTAARAATIILDGVRAGRWRILVGHDAEVLDGEVRANPEGAYEPAFWDHCQSLGILGGFGG